MLPHVSSVLLKEILFHLVSTIFKENGITTTQNGSPLLFPLRFHSIFWPFSSCRDNSLWAEREANRVVLLCRALTSIWKRLVHGTKVDLVSALFHMGFLGKVLFVFMFLNVIVRTSSPQKLLSLSLSCIIKCGWEWNIPRCGRNAWQCCVRLEMGPLVLLWVGGRLDGATWNGVR